MEPFPQLDGTSSSASLGHSLNNTEHKAQRRRKSSGLGGEIRAGDTGAPALSTMLPEAMSSALLRVCCPSQSRATALKLLSGDQEVF